MKARLQSRTRASVGSADGTSGAERSVTPSPYVCASHTVLFEAEPTPRCDVCGGPIDESDEGPMPGRGLHVWVRGGETRCEEPPLCASCANAIGVTAIARWSVEEEEG